MGIRYNLNGNKNLKLHLPDFAGTGSCEKNVSFGFLVTFLYSVFFKFRMIIMMIIRKLCFYYAVELCFFF